MPRLRPSFIVLSAPSTRPSASNMAMNLHLNMFLVQSLIFFLLSQIPCGRDRGAPRMALERPQLEIDVILPRAM